MLLEKTQRRLCRLLFILGCVLPTLAVAGFTTHRLRPGYTAELLLSAGEALGVEIACDRVTTPRPEVYALAGVRLVDKSTKDEIVACETLTLRRVQHGWRLAADGVEVATTAAESDWAHRLLDHSINVEGALTNVRLGDADHLETASVQLVSNADGARHFRVAGPGQSGWQATRLNDGLLLETNTAEHTCPAAWLADWPLEFACSDKARFSGQARIKYFDDDRPAAGVASGRVDVNELSLSGLSSSYGSIEVEAIEWIGDKLVGLDGRLELRDGQIDRTVLRGACWNLETKPFERLNTLWEDPRHETALPFSQLACQVELGGDGLTLVGGCDQIDGTLRGGAIAHSLLELDGEPLLREPKTRPLPIQRLVRTWFPDHRAEVPATPAAVEMMRTLPSGE